jgi:hypothetical protein
MRAERPGKVDRCYLLAPSDTAGHASQAAIAVTAVSRDHLQACGEASVEADQ